MASSKSIIIRKAGGFYHVFDDDALIINYLFNYKISNYRCGFPLKSLDKIINVIEEKQISYIIKDDQERMKDFKRKNKYNYYLEKSKAKESIDNRVNYIITKLQNLNTDKLDNILDSIESYIDE